MLDMAAIESAAGWGEIRDWLSLGLALLTAASTAVTYLLGRRNRRLKHELESRELELGNALKEIELQRSKLQERDLRLASALKEIDLERSKSAAFDELSDQAQTVSCTAFRGEDGRTAWEVKNDSDARIHNLEIRLYAGPEEKYTHVIPYLSPKSTYQATTFPFPNDPFSCEVRFRDLRGNYWRLDGYGTLTQLPSDYLPRVGVVPPGYFDEAP
jgi:hypothetical protein